MSDELLKPRKHHFRPSEDDRDTCRVCGHNFRNATIHCIGGEGPETDAQYIARLECALRLAAQSPEPVTVKPLVWVDHRPDSFPEPAWSAQTPFGFYNIEEVSASDCPAYVVRLHAHRFVADKDSLDAAKAAAQADYEQRIRSAIEIAPQSDRQPPPGQKQISETGKELPENAEQPMNNADVSVGELAGFFVTEFPHLLTMSTQIEVARALLARYRIGRLDRLASGRR